MYIREWTLFCANRWREGSIVAEVKERKREREKEREEEGESSF